MSPVTTHVEHRFTGWQVMLIAISLLAIMRSHHQNRGAFEPIYGSSNWFVSIRYSSCAWVCCGILQSLDLVIRPCPTCQAVCFCHVWEASFGAFERTLEWSERVESLLGYNFWKPQAPVDCGESDFKRVWRKGTIRPIGNKQCAFGQCLKDDIQRRSTSCTSMYLFEVPR